MICKIPQNVAIACLCIHQSLCGHAHQTMWSSQILLVVLRLHTYTSCYFSCSIFCLGRGTISLSQKVLLLASLFQEDLNPLDELDLISVPQMPPYVVVHLFLSSARCQPVHSLKEGACLTDFVFLELSSVRRTNHSTHPCLYLSIHLSKNGPQGGWNSVLSLLVFHMKFVCISHVHETYFWSRVFICPWQ